MLPIASVLLLASVLLAARRLGHRWALPVAVLLGAGGGALLGPHAAVAPLMGLMAAAQVERGRSYGCVCAAMAVAPAVLAGWLWWVQDDAVRQRMTSLLVEQLRALGLEPADDAVSWRQLVEVMVRLQPALEFMWLLVLGLLAYRLAAWLAPRLRARVPAPLPLHLWRPWDELIWLTILALALWLVASGRLRDVGLNVGVVMVAVYAVHGLALLRYALRRLRVARLLELALYAALFVSSGLSVVLLSGLGLLDTWFDWRRLRPAPAGQEPAR